MTDAIGAILILFGGAFCVYAGVASPNELMRGRLERAWFAAFGAISVIIGLIALLGARLQ